uniref:Terminase large subunit n=1 Tax=Siphoviridae sp. ctClL93 TaxID=2825381 RepID=A0A8S5VDX9_9CAUD|nr:MAG TPA: terminase large subunit [Siphoviridae sp. ctClL93]
MPRKGNTKNLVPMNKRTKEEQREIAQKGGIASVEARRANKSLASLAKSIAQQPAPEKLKSQITRAGLAIDDEDMTCNAAIVAGVYGKAISGDDRAVDRWENWTNDAAAEDKPCRIPADLIGKAFVDINRKIEPNRDYIFEGGRGGLKSTYISEKLTELLKNNPMMHACVVRKQTNTLKDSVFSQIQWAINEMGLTNEFDFKTHPPEITLKKTRQKIYFRGCDDPVKLKSIKPPFGYIGILWIEERDQLAGAAEERSVKQSVLRGGVDSYFFGSYNPPKSRANWVNQQLLEPDKNRIVHHSTYMDAPAEWLGTMFLNDAEHLKEVNPAAYEHEYLGVPNGDGGNVFDNITARAITDDEIARFDRIYQGVDFGWYPDPFAFLRMHYDVTNETLYFIDEHRSNKTSNADNAAWIKQQGYDDFPVVCDSAEPKSVADMRASGVDARAAIKGPGSVEYGMKWLQCRRIVIDPMRTPEAYKEFINYEYERDKDGNVISGYPDKDDHFISAARYGMERVFRLYGVRA